VYYVFCHLHTDRQTDRRVVDQDVAVAHVMTATNLRMFM